LEELEKDTRVNGAHIISVMYCRKWYRLCKCSTYK